MQALSLFQNPSAYTDGMPAGRPAKFSRSLFGQRLFVARQQMGLSQIQIAEKLGITQSTYAGWERRTTALRPDYISRLAAVLNVTVDDLLGHEAGPRRNGGPVGKARRVFEQVSKLPRHQQKRILGIVEDLLAAQQMPRQARAQ